MIMISNSDLFFKQGLVITTKAYIQNRQTWSEEGAFGIFKMYKPRKTSSEACMCEKERETFKCDKKRRDTTSSYHTLQAPNTPHPINENTTTQLSRTALTFTHTHVVQGLFKDMIFILNKVNYMVNLITLKQTFLHFYAIKQTCCANWLQLVKLSTRLYLDNSIKAHWLYWNRYFKVHFNPISLE